MNNQARCVAGRGEVHRSCESRGEEVPGRQVGTVGRINALPGAPNVIPGKVVLSLELRDLDAAKINLLFERIQPSTKNRRRQQDEVRLQRDQRQHSGANRSEDPHVNLGGGK